MKEHRFSLPFTSFGSFCLKQYFANGEARTNFDKGCPIVAETCARRGAGFSRFLQLVPGEGESQTTGKLGVLHFFYTGQPNIAVFAMDGRSESGVHC